ncbi:unnamed protein product [Protopolystoma xenopodis]|uniref:Uncharacterized protein n=1 Tax=Protopolystoma xenopodis TaxID=117903 RepID=A0A3S5CRF8_9PLAT|nr:unnamed protein product [Protopolystoma xenopodis]
MGVTMLLLIEAPEVDDEKGEEDEEGEEVEEGGDTKSRLLAARDFIIIPLESDLSRMSLSESISELDFNIIERQEVKFVSTDAVEDEFEGNWRDCVEANGLEGSAVEKEEEEEQKEFDFSLSGVLVVNIRLSIFCVSIPSACSSMLESGNAAADITINIPVPVIILDDNGVLRFYEIITMT